MKYIFHGNVQGVGFRYFTKQMARRFNISGSVRNKPDGKVELILNDENNNIKEFMEAIKKGNGFMKIKNIEKYDYESNASDFKVKY